MRAITRTPVTRSGMHGLDQAQRCLCAMQGVQQVSFGIAAVVRQGPTLRQEFKEKFQAADGSRTAVVLRARGLLGDEVKALVRTVLTETTTQTNSLKRKQQVEYLDEADLKKRLAHKPEQVQRIIDKGPLFEHPETGAQMYTFRTFTQASNPLLLCYVLDDSVALLSIEV